MAKAKTSSKVTLKLSQEEAEAVASILAICSGRGDQNEIVAGIRIALDDAGVDSCTLDTEWDEDDATLYVTEPGGWPKQS